MHPRSPVRPPFARPLLALPLLALAGCEETAPSGQGVGGSTTSRYERAEQDGDMLADMVAPVRIGELGANFAACNARGTVRTRAVGGPVPVRAAPYGQAAEIDRLPLGAQFFICTRSHDQRWFGIVYGEGGRAAPACGVSAPAPERDYSGPCASGWVSSAQVRFVAGRDWEEPAAEETPPAEGG